MFERFSDAARVSMARANQEAQRLSDEYIGSHHILLGITKTPGCAGLRVLESLVGPEVGGKVDDLFRRGLEVPAQSRLPKTPSAKRTVEHAIAESLAMNCSYVGTEHLLLGLLLEPEFAAAKVLAKLGLTLARVRSEIAHLPPNLESGAAS